MISIVIPTYNMKDADFFLRRCLDSIRIQIFRDYEVIITDNSPDDTLEKICNEYDIGIHYARNTEKTGMARNTNQSIRFANGDIIKILYMDDYLANRNVLQNIYRAFSNRKVYWLASGCLHDTGNGQLFNPHFAKWNDNIYQGLNTIGSPSVIAFRNRNPLFFNEKMTWVLDCDYYYRLYKKYGEPRILNKYDIVIGVGEHQMTNLLTNEQKVSEQQELINQYDTSK